MTCKDLISGNIPNFALAIGRTGCEFLRMAIADSLYNFNQYCIMTEKLIAKIKEKVKENLLDIGYYRLGFYWFPFEVTFPRIEKRDHKFKERTLFENVIQLYYFDFDVRNIFLRYISRIEINFRTKLIYIASNHFRDNPFWYVDSKCVKKDFLESDDYQRAQDKVSSELCSCVEGNRIYVFRYRYSVVQQSER